MNQIKHNAFILPKKIDYYFSHPIYFLARPIFSKNTLCLNYIIGTDSGNKIRTNSWILNLKNPDGF